jgi:hypothetical protein
MLPEIVPSCVGGEIDFDPTIDDEPLNNSESNDSDLESNMQLSGDESNAFNCP